MLLDLHNCKLFHKPNCVCPREHLICALQVGAQLTCCYTSPMYEACAVFCAHSVTFIWVISVS